MMTVAVVSRYTHSLPQAHLESMVAKEVPRIAAAAVIALLPFARLADWGVARFPRSLATASSFLLLLARPIGVVELRSPHSSTAEGVGS